jgi:hypothetical protein
MTVRDVNEYEDLLAEWADLESGLGILLAYPDQSREFVARVGQYERWMQSLMDRDPDVGLYLLFQLAGNSSVGYSASHALICAVVCHLLRPELMLNPWDGDSLVRAALTMNIAMTRMQDQLAVQRERPSPEQQAMIQQHPARGIEMLRDFGVDDSMWLAIIASHHDNMVDEGAYDEVPVAQQMGRILKRVDRYIAMISPRLSRAGRSATDSARAIMASTSAQQDPVGHAVVRSVGLCPPGTFVRMDNDELGLVVKRSTIASHPYIAVVGDASGELLSEPRLHDPARGGPQIQAALPATGVRAVLNHARILQLGARIIID